MHKRSFMLTVILAAVGCNGSTPPQPVSAVTTQAAATPLAPQNRIEYPSYTSWAKHPVGTSVMIDDVIETPGGTKRGSSVYRLTALTEAVATVEVRSDDPADTEPNELKYPRWMAKPEGKAAKFPGAPEGTYEAGKETLTIQGKEYPCQWYKSKGQVEAGPTESQTWLCDDVPGGMVKAFRKVPSIKQTITSTLTKVERP